MSGSGGYQASLAALTEAARGIEDTLAALRSIGSVGRARAGRGVLGLALDPDAVGHAGFASAFSDFCTRWEWGVRALVRAGEDIAAGLAETGTAYQRAEHEARGLLRRVVFDATGDPGGDPAEAEHASWEALGQGLRPDVGAASFRRAGEHIEQTWRAQARDVAENSTPGLIARALRGENPLRGQVEDLESLTEIGD